MDPAGASGSRSAPSPSTARVRSSFGSIVHWIAPVPGLNVQPVTASALPAPTIANAWNPTSAKVTTSARELLARRDFPLRRKLIQAPFSPPSYEHFFAQGRKDPAGEDGGMLCP